ncbi:MAG: CRISPR-associated endonuclease Cas1 [Syntrophorhabdaceae bacterium PtaU1.Bin034]|jgi:CRISPR-associated endonuclease Cas1|nr:MAG: CRISPR-associated endonuclease Cas1 [Syntrophorhabdaceae bacterium PtaU1.Bin034]
MTKVVVPDLILLELTFRALAPINKLSHFHGVQWGALFKRLINQSSVQDRDALKAALLIQPVEMGITAYEEGNLIRLGLAFPSAYAADIGVLLENFNNLSTGKGHFQPGKTIVLEEVRCRITGEAWTPDASAVLTADLIQQEAKALAGLNRFHIVTSTPLRLTRPEGQKSEGHRYCDEQFFLEDRSGRQTKAIAHFLNGIRTSTASEDLRAHCHIEDGALMWVDVPYGMEEKKTLGGVVGSLVLTEPIPQEEAGLLVLGQYTGVGKNGSMGFGFYSIPELENKGGVRQLFRGKTLLQRTASPGYLKQCLGKLQNSSPGPDTLSVKDLKAAGESWLRKLSHALLDGSYRPGATKQYRMVKTDGNFRTIDVQNAADRLVQKAAADILSPAMDVVLSQSAYAYRRGLNRAGAVQAMQKALSEGYTSGIKADISSFFESVNTKALALLLSGVFPAEPLTDRLKTWLEERDGQGGKGLSQGSPLSPVLSNLYLHRFDTDVQSEGLRLIRYGDDFVILSKTDEDRDRGLAVVRRSLDRLGLALKEEKTQLVSPGDPIAFLGYVVNATETKIEGEDEEHKNEDTWLPVFREDWKTGVPLYLSTACLGARSSGPSIMVKVEGDREEHIPWSSISRIVVVGKTTFTGGLIYRAVKEDIPVAFIDIMGRAKGTLIPESHENYNLSRFQEEYSKNEAWILDFAKEIIAAKIHNSMVLLRRNSTPCPDLAGLVNDVKSADGLEALRGYEGAAAKTYFASLASLVAPFEFKGRKYNPPDGPVNVMLSLGYTLLYNRIASALRAKGFDARRGFFHKGRGSHAALASDLIEELRHVVERIVLAAIHLREIDPKDFSHVKKQGFTYSRLNGEGFRKYIRRFEKTMAAKFSLSAGKISYNGYLDVMADSLARALRLDIQYLPLRID